MFYDPRTQPHGLARDPMTSLVVPRPIAWISTLNEAGRVNLAPFSFYNIVSTRPPAVMFSSSGPKDTAHNARRTGEFVVNMPSYEMREQMMLTSREVGPEVSEAELAGIEMAPSVGVGPPRVKKSPVSLECRYLRTVELDDAADGGPGNSVVFGAVVGVHIDDALLEEGYVRWPQEKILFRLGYLDYGVVRDSFALARPS